MADEVNAVVNDVTTPEKVVEAPKVVSADEYNALKTELEKIKGSFQEQVNKASKAEREKYEKQLAKATMTAEEKMKAEQEEKFNQVISELTTLKTEKKQLTTSKLLQEAELPTILANDVRLVNAEVDDLPKVVKELKKEYGDYLVKSQKVVGGATPKTQPTTATGSNMVDKVVSQNPILAQYLKPRGK
jgi:flagellar biosynthesis/type III secretory pathway protein FliH